MVDPLWTTACPEDDDRSVTDVSVGTTRIGDPNCRPLHPPGRRPIMPCPPAHGAQWHAHTSRQSISPGTDCPKFDHRTSPLPEPVTTAYSGDSLCCDRASAWEPVLTSSRHVRLRPVGRRRCFFVEASFVEPVGVMQDGDLDLISVLPR